MIRRKIPWMGLVILFFCLQLWGCNSLLTAPISKILEDPRAYVGKTATVSGKVTKVFSLVVIKYFAVRDRTDEIIIVTERPLPSIGTKIKVKGTVEEAFSIGDKQLIVIVEKNQGE